MSEQLGMDVDEQVDTKLSHREDALCGILIGFAGFADRKRAPMALKQEAMGLAREALAKMQAKRRELGLDE